MNFLFQCLNFGILKPLLTRRGKQGLERYELWFYVQTLIAKSMDRVIIIIGDSNAEVFCQFNVLSKAGRFVLSLGCGGTTTDCWLSWFTTDTGKKVCQYLKKGLGHHTIWNIGGNNSLKSKMESVEHNLKVLKSLFPLSYNCTIPPIKYDWLDKMSEYKDANDWEKEMLLINTYIRKAWMNQTIDIYNWLSEFDQVALDLVLKDAVHYADRTVQYIFKFFRYV